MDYISKEKIDKYRNEASAELGFGFKVLPKAVFDQFRKTLPLYRTEKEWEWLLKSIKEEISFYANLKEAKKKVSMANTAFKKTGRWPDGYDPNTDYVKEASTREGYPDWKP